MNQYNNTCFPFKRILITGGAGFIGGTLIRRLLKETDSIIFNIDKLGYASDLSWLKKLGTQSQRHTHICLDLNDLKATKLAIKKADPDLVIHLAAESHVDRSLDDPSLFVQSNIIGTFNLLEATRDHWQQLKSNRKEYFRFHHISTDEVFGSLGEVGAFNEETPYSPRSPYSASKASSDHLVNSWHHSYQMPTLITNCSNNYGPYQFPEKLIPVAILKALNNESIPLYGDGKNIRDWLYVEDHVDAIMLVARKGVIGKSYCIGGFGETTNQEILKMICSCLDKFKPSRKPHSELIKLVKDRPGHDKRYSIDPKRIIQDLGWEPKVNLEKGLEITVKWYLENIEWCEFVMRKSGYIGQRLGQI